MYHAEAPFIMIKIAWKKHCISSGKIIDENGDISRPQGGFCKIIAKMNDLMTRSFLSYVELKKQAQKDLQVELDIESGQPNLSQFFHEVNGIKTEMEDITNLLFDLQKP